MVSNLDLLVSIVVPCFNQAAYLKQAIDSVLSQDYPKIELIVLDDGSTDETPEVLQRYQGRATIIRQENRGQAATLTKGWQHARGEVLSYLAADDFLLPNAVRKSVETLYANADAVMTYCDFDLVDPAGKFVRRVQTPDYSYHDMVVRTICAPGPGVFFRRSAYERAGAWNPRLRQVPDYEFWLRLGLEGRFVRIPEVLACYRAHEQSQSFAPVSIERAEETLNVIAEHLKCPRLPSDIASARNEALSNAHVVTARFHLRSARWRLATQHLSAAWRLFPRNFLRGRTLRLIGNGLFNRAGHRLFWLLNSLKHDNAAR